MEPEDWVTVVDAAAELGIPAHRINDWAARGLVRPVFRDRPGGRAPRRFRFADLVEVDARVGSRRLLTAEQDRARLAAIP